ncbi:MAG: hypothetical protein J5738_06125 [Lachnospiraceae bacterium]|nr:hypothetical protein [Lachnospiraceae bacterium]
MRKPIALLLVLLTVISVAGCGAGNGGRRTGDNPNSVNDVLRKGMAEADGNVSPTASPVKPSEPDTVLEYTPEEPEEPNDTQVSLRNGDIDVDLTVLSSTLVYAEVYHMVTAPQDYVGQTVKMQGTFAYYYDQEIDCYYSACIIQDATACCSQGIEFVLTDEFIFPDDYPEPGTDICVIGEFSTYTEHGTVYCTLKNAKLL